MKNRLSAALLGGACLVCTSLLQAEDAPRRHAWFGDLHIHTSFSFDAFMLTTRNSPDDAYRYAKGEAIPRPGGGTVRLSGPPLDFLAVTDHGEYLGTHVALTTPGSPTWKHPETPNILPESREGFNAAFSHFIQLVEEGSDVAGEAVIADAWRKTIEAAERHNDPGRFTALVGYEYTLSPGARHLHRNVIFRSASVPDKPFTARDGNPEDLWNWLDGLREQGIEALAIPHNMNQSDGLAFQTTTWDDGEPIDRTFAEKRIRNEPIAEITQKKGTSETHPLLSPNDEWADFQIVRYYLNRAENKNPISVFKGGYWRDALLTGLQLDAELGVNPFQLGAIGASDSHAGAGSFEEDNYFTIGDNTPRSRGSAPDEGGEWEDYWTPREATHGTGGLAGVWAEENTRASLFDAMRRKETFATSGPRIQVRFFGGFGLATALKETSDLIAEAYAAGVPMGGELVPGGDDNPAFLVWAARDPAAGWLQRIQIIKGWYDGEDRVEQIYDVACSDGLTPDPETHRCPDNGARVNLVDCSVSRDKGNVELRSVWQDPDFDPDTPAFYYVRVLENPSCRWSTWDAVRQGIEPNPDLNPVIQERAWSSPIWYRPG